ncbi:MAG: peptidoglycan DD-metalloendopeptidase family protein [Gammaproteobacteria bacterium]|nr:peptidoglycan DD-metalloendopeptidase family protein [Gammaproteobacteria bacterium]
MSMVIDNSKSSGRFCIALGLPVLMLISACTGGGYQAPVTDNSEAINRQAVIIVTDSDDRPSRYIGATNSPSREVRSSAGTQTRFHRVARGDTLYSIAFQYDLDFRNLALANNLRPPYTIRIGQQLSLDINRQMTPVTPSGTSAGRVVGNNTVARSQGASSSGSGVTRQSITRRAVSRDPQWQWPVRGGLINNFQTNSGAGKGIDISAVNGQAVRSAASGEVVYAGNGIQGSGNLIIIRHSDRFLSAYAHNSTMAVTEGDRIGAGDQIAEVGANPEGVPMLHFEIRLDGQPVDPLRYLPRL